MPDTPTTEPLSFSAGDTVTWLKSLDDYPATSYTLTYYLVKASVQITFSASASGTDHLVTLAAATTANYTAGTYTWKSYALASGVRYPVGEGTIDILPNFAAASSGYDARTNVKKILDAINALLEGRFDADVENYSIAGRSLTKMSLTDLMDARAKYQSLYNQELRKLGQTRSNKIQITFKGN